MGDGLRAYAYAAVVFGDAYSLGLGVDVLLGFVLNLWPQSRHRRMNFGYLFSQRKQTFDTS